ncbi:MAG: hypothetical protein WD273_09695 [Trueperaceae bacterium]
MTIVNTDALEADVYTFTQRVFGLIHPTAGAAVAEFLNRTDRAMLPVTNALVYQPGSPRPPAAQERVAVASFYAVPKEQILWIRSGYFEAAAPLGYDTKRVAVYFDDYCIAGDIRLPHNSRLSDHLERSTRDKPFQRLFQATVAPAPKGPNLDAANGQEFAASEVLSVNFRNARGIAELTATRQSAYEPASRGSAVEVGKQKSDSV